MAEFARIFKVENGEQVLVFVTNDDESEPVLKFLARFDGAEAAVSIGFRRKPEEGANAIAMHALDMVTQDKVQKTYNEMAEYFESESYVTE